MKVFTVFISWHKHGYTLLCRNTNVSLHYAAPDPWTGVKYIIYSICTVKVLVAKWCLTLCNPMDCNPPGSAVHGILQARILEVVGSDSLLWGIFQTRDPTQGLLHCRQILYRLSHQGSPRIQVHSPFFEPIGTRCVLGLEFFWGKKKKEFFWILGGNTGHI